MVNNYQLRTKNDELRTTGNRQPATGKPSTSVENPLQIGSFMQNKPNLLNAQIDVSSFITKDYENKSNWKLGKNKANTKPIKANLLDTQMNATSVLTKNYVNEQRTMNNCAKQTQSNPILKQLQSPVFAA